MKKKVWLILWSLLLVLPLAVSVSSPTVANAAIGSSDFLKTSGTILKNNYGTGSEVQLRGTNLGGWLLEESWMAPQGEAALDRTGWIAYASSTEAGGSPGNALDGNMSTRWSTGAAQTNGQWFKVDLGSNQTFDMLSMDAGSSTGDFPAGYHIQGSTDGVNWSDIASGTGSQQNTVVTFGPVTYRYVLIFQTGSKGNWWSIHEFNLYLADEWSVRAKLASRFGQSTADSIYATYQDTWIQSSDLDNIKSMGLNLVRVPIYWENLMNRDGSMKPDSVAFRKLDWLVSQCQQRGIYVLLDLHGVPGGDDGWQSGGRVDNELWTNSTYQNWVVQIWQRLATHYKGSPTIAGYDLLNEPVSNNSNLSISQFYNTLYGAVRAIDPDHIIVVEAFYYWGNIVSPSTYGWQNVVYELHTYNWTSGDYNSQLNSVNSWLSDIATYQKNWNIPVYAGEFCLWSYTDLWEKYLSGLDALHVSWTNWAYKNKNDANHKDTSGNSDGGNWGLYNTDTNPIPDVNNDDATTIQNKLSYFSTNYFQANTTLQNIFKAYSVDPGNSSLKAMANGEYVCADNYGNNPLIANRTSVGAWESYKIYQNADGTVSFLSMANNKFVSADLNQSTKLIAEANGIDSWEKFRQINNGDGTVSFQSVANNDYVSADLNYSGVLYANRTAIGGWEKFVINAAP